MVPKFHLQCVRRRQEHESWKAELGSEAQRTSSPKEPGDYAFEILQRDSGEGFLQISGGCSWDILGQWTFSHMLHGAGIVTNICPKNHPVL